jgi:hypothetical protein
LLKTGLNECCPAKFFIINHFFQLVREVGSHGSV